LEDNIERDDFTDTVMELAGNQIAIDLEELGIKGNIGDGDAFLNTQDGWVKRTTSNSVDAVNAKISKELFRDMMKALPDAYHRNRSTYRHFVSVDNEIDYRDQLGDRSTTLGDSIIQGTSDVFAYGTPVVPVSQIPATQVLYTDPKNLIIGLHRNVLIETDKDIRGRVWIIVMTVRAGIQVEDELGVVKAVNVG
jgi:hypothetical protein